MKKIILIVLTVLVIFVLIVLCGEIIILKKDNNELQQNANNEINNDISGENDVNNNNENLNEQNNSNINENSSNMNEIKKENSFEIYKIDSEDFKNSYTIVEPYEIITENYFNVKKQNDNVVISLIDSKQNQELLQDKESGLTYNKEYIISNIEAKDVVDIFYGGEGQELNYPLVFFLQKDGTVKGIDIEYGYNTGNFIAEDIPEIKNVEKIEQADVTRINDSGYVAVVAITKDNEAYEIRKQDN